MATIYMPLLNEGVDVWRPVEATRLSADTYRLEGEVPDEEEWKFLPSTLVRCELLTLSSGERLVAIEAVG